MEINTLGMKPRGNCCPHAIIQNFINFDFTSLFLLIVCFFFYNSSVGYKIDNRRVLFI